MRMLEPDKVGAGTFGHLVLSMICLSFGIIEKNGVWRENSKTVPEKKGGVTPATFPF